MPHPNPSACERRAPGRMLLVFLTPNTTHTPLLFVVPHPRKLAVLVCRTRSGRGGRPQTHADERSRWSRAPPRARHGAAYGARRATPCPRRAVHGRRTGEVSLHPTRGVTSAACECHRGRRARRMAPYAGGRVGASTPKGAPSGGPRGGRCAPAGAPTRWASRAGFARRQLVRRWLRRGCLAALGAASPGQARLTVSGVSVAPCRHRGRRRHLTLVGGR